jgi:metal-responsive CopG/Arc/MetJ family transcriptional regulator
MLKLVTLRLPAHVLEQLDEIARNRRRRTGENTTRSELMREALEQYLAKPQ